MNKDAAIKAGEVSGQKFGKLNVFVYGGTVQERTAVLAALADVFTKSQHGGTQLQALESRKTWLGLGSVKPFDFIISINSMGSYTYRGSQGMVIDPSDVGAAYNSQRPGGTFTLQRIIAHELGHAAMGTRDAGVNRMDNVIKHENSIMRQLGDTNDRIIY